jgi:hypothetical protein
MKKHSLSGLALGLIASTCALGSAHASPGPLESLFGLSVYDYRDNRLYTGDGDWRYGFSKTECGYSYPTIVSLATEGFINGNDEYEWSTLAMLCATSNTIWVNYDDGDSNWFGGNDARRDTRQGDWAPGLAKAECGFTEVMTGFAEQTEGINEFRCSPGYTSWVGDPLHATSCSVVDFDGHDGFDPVPNFGPNSRGDWVSGLDKGSCAHNRYIKGFAVDNEEGTTRPVKVLCCGAQLYPDGAPCNYDEQCLGGNCTSGFVCETPVVK